MECVLQGEISTMAVENQGPEGSEPFKNCFCCCCGGGGGEVSGQHWPGNIVCFVVVVLFFVIVVVVVLFCCCFFLGGGGGGVLWTTLAWEYCLGGFSGQYLTFAEHHSCRPELALA